jgi:predicted Zn-dependent protease
MAKRERILELLGSAPDDVFLNYSLAMCLANEGAPDEAVARYARVRQLDPNYVPAYFQEGQVLAKLGRTDAARAILTQGMTVARSVGDQHALGEMAAFLDML